MSACERYEFPTSLRGAYERLLFPLAVYQFVAGKVVTLLVSDGMCEFMGQERDTLVNHYDQDMFGGVHPDDREMLANLGGRFAVKEGPYDIVYRDHAIGREGYRYVHTVGKYHSMDDGTRVAFLVYADISASVDSLVKTFDEKDSPQARFLDENDTAMVVVSSVDSHVIYCNKAARRMLPPQTDFDSYITFQDYFYRDIPGGIPNLFDIVGAGPHDVVEPRTGRSLEANVTRSEWGGEPVYLVKMLELGESFDEGISAEMELHRRRAAFNAIMFSGEGNDLPYYVQGYRGFRVWNLTENRMVLSSGSDFLQTRYGANMTYDSYLDHVASSSRTGGDELRRDCSRDALMLLYENGMQAPEMTVELDSPRGLAAVRARFALMCSPDAGDLYVRVAEENITDETVVERLAEAMVSQEFDFVAYVDGESGTCHMVFGKTSNDLQRSFSARLDEYCETLSGLVGRRFVTIDGLERFVREVSRDDGDHTETFELGDGSIKSVRVSVLDAEHRVYYIRRSDVTALIGEERRRERELSQAMLEASEASETESRFLSSMSHDMRTPLNGILGFSRLALESDDAERRQDYLEKITQSGELMLDLVNDVLDLSKMDSGKLELFPVDVDAHTLVSGITGTIEELAAEKHIDFQVDTGHASLGVVHVDPLRVQQVCLNLLTNAVKYTPEGGMVRFEMTYLEDPVDGCNVRAIVSDTGIGMSSEFIPHAFEPFSQEHRKEARGVQGTGLGLDIVKRIVDLMGGSVQVVSEMGKGSTFTVWLPMEVVGRSLEPEKDDTPEPTLDLTGRNILVCEDNYLNAEIADTLLKDIGATVVDATDGAEALATFSASLPGFFSAVLMDVRMPVMDGLEATRRIRALDREDATVVPIIAMTADAFAEDIERCLDAGMVDHVSKPIMPQTFCATLSRHIR